MYLTGFADEASQNIDNQIKVTKALGWKNIEARNIQGKNIVDISEEDFDIVYGKLQEAGVSINCFGSAIANWGKSINDPFEITLNEIKTAVPRMKKLGTKLIRVMSYAILNAPATKEDQMFDERVKRLREMKKIFDDNDITMVHENCMNYGGMGWAYTLDLIEAIQGLKLVFDTGNPVFNKDFCKCDVYETDASVGIRQDAWEFYTKVKPYIEYIHIKDGYYDYQNKKTVFTYPNAGNGYVKEILTDLINSGYDGGISIEPHVATVFHETAKENEIEEMKYNTYFYYGYIVNQLIDNIKMSKII